MGRQPRATASPSRCTPPAGSTTAGPSIAAVNAERATARPATADRRRDRRNVPPDETSQYPDRFIHKAEYTDGFGRLLQTRSPRRRHHPRRPRPHGRPDRSPGRSSPTSGPRRTPAGRGQRLEDLRQQGPESSRSTSRTSTPAGPTGRPTADQLGGSSPRSSPSTTRAAWPSARSDPTDPSSASCPASQPT